MHHTVKKTDVLKVWMKIFFKIMLEKKNDENDCVGAIISCNTMMFNRTKAGVYLRMASS